MSTRLLFTLVLVSMLTAFSGIRAADGDTPTPPRRQGGNNQAQTILDHADELGLTAEQKTKLEEFKKGPMSVLTDDQKTKARAFLPQRPGAGNRNRPNAADAKPSTDEKKPADAKPDEKKPDEKKPDEAK
ncbi:MAG TPA: hypothetical protein VKX17_22060 [Planctomycetota bacterium]|nr:hypothetical protein [Planctomycetota bacterium]